MNRRPGFVAIYFLLDADAVVRYIGRTVDVVDRERSHRLRRPWVHEMRVIEWASDKLWSERERHWIAHGRANGWPLENIARGGQGHPASAAQRAKASAAQKGKKPTLAARAKYKAAWVVRKRRGWSHSREARAKISAVHRGRKHSRAWKLNMQRKMRGRVVTGRMRANLLLLNIAKTVCKRTFGVTWIKCAPRSLSASHKASLRVAWTRRKAEGRTDCISAAGKENIRAAAHKRWAEWRDKRNVARYKYSAQG